MSVQMPVFLSLVVVFGALQIASARPSTAAIMRDQGQIFNTEGEILLGTDLFSQSVTSGISGGLAAIEVQYDTQTTQIQPVSYSVFSGGNPPSGDPLFSELVDSPDLDEDGVFRWELPSADLFFAAGNTFTFTFQASAPGVSFAANDPPGYGGGELLRNGSPADLSDVAFITYVDTGVPVPEPAALPFFASALAFLGIIGWRRLKA